MYFHNFGIDMVDRQCLYLGGNSHALLFVRLSGEDTHSQDVITIITSRIMARVQRIFSEYKA
jgi:hypothetical protein